MMSGMSDHLPVRPTPAPASRHCDAEHWDEEVRPLAPVVLAGERFSRSGVAIAGHLIDVHDHLRSELDQIRGMVDQVRVAGIDGVGAARETLHAMTLRQNSWMLGAYCARYCSMITGHHNLESSGIFPHLKASDPALAPVIDRLDEEHEVIHHLVEAIDAALVAFVSADEAAGLDGLQAAVDGLTDALLSHLSYEEHQLVAPLARHGFYPGQV